MKTALLIFAIVCIAGIAARTTSGCPPGQYVYETNQCKNCAANCKTCTDGTHKGCSECTGTTFGKWLGDDYGCITTLTQCAEFCEVSSTIACNGCAAGYYNLQDVNATSIAICEPCSTISNCAQCSDKQTCTKCAAGFYLDTTAKLCKACISGCADCSDATTCNTCSAAYVKDSTGKCQTCGTDCSECDAADTNKCSKCVAGAFLDSATNTCTKIANCEEGADKKCTVCNDGYRLKSDGTCAACTGNASLCNPGATDNDQTIIACNVGFIKTKPGTTNTAVTCTALTSNPNCIEMDSDGNCTKCDSTTVLTTDWKCSACSTVVAGCAACVATTDKTKAATCSSCMEGYYASATTPITCTACAETGCKDCTATACNACKDAYTDAATATGATSKTCDACPTGASACSNKNTATTCKTGYQKHSVGICRVCNPDNGCADCTVFGTCISCPNPKTHSINGGKCVACDSNCLEGDQANGGCATQGVGKCDSNCKTGYVINKLTYKCTNKCEVSNCKTCAAADNGECTTCNDGYVVSNKACVACTDADCKTCAATGATQCQACWNNKGLTRDASDASQKTCGVSCGATDSNVESCTTKWNAGASPAATEIDGTKFICKSGYGIKNPATAADACGACSSNCSKCSSEGAGKCDSLGDCDVTKSFYDTTGKTCVTAALETGMKTWASGGGTDKASIDAASCNTGYFLNAASPKRCDPCSANCKACTVKDQCTAGQCDEGYGLAGGNACVKCDDANCANCKTAKTKCDASGDCKTGFLLNTPATGATAVCSKKDSVSNCKTFSTTVSDRCDACKDGFALNTEKSACEACGANCKCATKAECDSCISNAFFFDSTAKTCTACSVANCADCSSDKAKCTTCADGYIKNTDGTACDACAPNCKTCTVKDKCTTCAVGYGTTSVDAAQELCLACPSNCETCTVDSKEVKTCTKCKDGYYLNASKSCVNTNCNAATGYGAKADGTNCTRCPYGYKLGSGSTGCVECKSDASCPKSCSSAPTVTPGTGTGGATNGTDSSNSVKLAFNLFVLAFVAILGHMMI